MQPDFERLRAMIRHEEPDRVPLCEVLIEYPIQSAFLGRNVASDDLGAQVEFWAAAGYDYIPITVGAMKPGRVTEESRISKVLKDMTTNQRGEKSWNVEYSSFISNREEFDAFPWDSLSHMDFSALEGLGPLLPSGMKVIAVSGKIFTLAWMLMGFNNFGTALLEDERLVADVVQRIAQVQMTALDRMVHMPFVGGVWVVDDMAFSSGPMLPPQAFRDHIFPWYRRMARMCHDNGLVFFVHSDGDLASLMDDLIDVGVDALHPVDPTCMDIVSVKREFGDRIALIGNVSTELLRSASPARVEQEVERLLREVAPGGGYGLGSGNSVPEWAAFENYMAMHDAALRFGAYPIRL